MWKLLDGLGRWLIVPLLLPCALFSIDTIWLLFKGNGLGALVVAVLAVCSCLLAIYLAGTARRYSLAVPSGRRPISPPDVAKDLGAEHAYVATPVTAAAAASTSETVVELEHSTKPADVPPPATLPRYTVSARTGHAIAYLLAGLLLLAVLGIGRFTIWLAAQGNWLGASGCGVIGFGALLGVFGLPSRVGSRALALSTRIALVLAVVVLALSLLSSEGARVPFTVRVSGSTATLSIDGQPPLVTSSFAGINAVSPADDDPDLRLFQIDGTDISGTTSENSDTLAAIIHTPYYHFLCWLRDCSSYSQWMDFSLHDDGSNRALLSHASLQALQAVQLPGQFTLHGVFGRPERARTLNFSGPTTVQLTINVDTRSVSFGSQTAYFPHSTLPFLALVAWTITRSYLFGGLLLLLLIVVFGLLTAGLLTLIESRLGPLRLPVLRHKWSFTRIWPFISVGATSIILAVLLTISDVTYQRLPHILDAIAYYFQASIIRSGHFGIPTPAVVDNFMGPFMISYHGQWFSHYPPGAPLAIALGMLLNAGWAVEPIMGAASAYMMARLALRWYGHVEAVLTLLLVGFSPFFLFLASSYMSHAIGLCWLLVFLTGIDLLEETGRAHWAVLASAGVGLGFLTREFSTVLFVLVVACFYGVRFLLKLRQRGVLWPTWQMVRMVAALAVPGLLCLAFYLFYDWRLTGSALLSPRTIFDSRDTWGFGTGKGWYNLHTYAAGAFVAENQLTSLLIDLFGWPYYLTLGFFFLPLSTMRLKAHDLLLYALTAIFVAGYSGLYYHGIAFGPRYYLETLIAFILLTARGIVVAASLTGTILQRLVRVPHARAAGVVATSLALIGLLLCNITFYLPKEFPLYFDYTEHRVSGGMSYDSLHPSWLHNAIVLTDDGDLYNNVLFPLNDPLLRGDVLFAKADLQAGIGGLLAAYPHRNYYWLSLANQQIHFQPLTVLARPVGSVTLQTTIATGGNYSSLAADSTGSVFVANASDGTILRFDAAGSLIQTISTGIPANSLFSIDVAGGDLYWLNPASNRLWAMNLQSGRSRVVFTCACSSPRSFTVGPGGDVYVADTANSAVRQFDKVGKQVAVASLQQPFSVAVAANGDVFAYGLGMSEVTMFDPSLHTIRQLPFGSDSGLQTTRLAAHGDWIVIGDSGMARLVAYNARTGDLRYASLTSSGAFLATAAWGITWIGDQLMVADGQPGEPSVLFKLTPGTPPF